LEKMLRIAVVQPSSLPKEEDLAKGLQVLKELGLSFKSFADPTPSIPSVTAFLLAEIIATQEFDYLWAVRGGFGAIKILPFLDEYLKNLNLKPFQIPPIIGFSDITALHSYFWKKFGIIGIHAPMVVNLPEVERDCLDLLLEILHRKRMELMLEGRAYREGEAKGYLFGGNLATFASLCGTAYLPLEEEMILFFEDVNEAPHRLERALMQVILSISLQRIKGILFGDLSGISSEALLHSLQQNLPENIPIGVDFPLGHGKKNYPLIFGAKVKFSCHGGKAILNMEVPLR
jgi:muramoyltetrapeptide carboxypeptidase